MCCFSYPKLHKFKKFKSFFNFHRSIHTTSIFRLSWKRSRDCHEDWVSEGNSCTYTMYIPDRDWSHRIILIYILKIYLNLICLLYLWKSTDDVSALIPTLHWRVVFVISLDTRSLDCDILDLIHVYDSTQSYDVQIYPQTSTRHCIT